MRDRAIQESIVCRALSTVCLILVLTGCAVDAHGESESPSSWRSELYPENWTPAFTLSDGRFLHDFSYAGYRAGEAPLPRERREPVVSVLDHGADPTGAADSTVAIQAAIDALPAGGTVWLPQGLYRVEGELRVTAHGVVVAGEGPRRTRVHFTRDRDTTNGAGLWFRGARAGRGEWELAKDATPRSKRVRVKEARGLEPGDAVALGFIITDAFRAEHGMQRYWKFAAGRWRAFARRTVRAIEGDFVVLDVPVRYPAKVRDGASLRADDGYLREVGLADLAISSVVSREAALAADRHHAVAFDRVQDGWVRDVHTFSPAGEAAHVQSGGLLVMRSRRMTIADIDLGPSQNRGGGGNGYLLEISRSNEVLVRDTVARGGRHNFIQNWDFATSGCVFLRTHSQGGRAEGLMTTVGYSEYHHALAHANLVDDSVADDGWQAKNRRHYSSGAGHAATESVFWNVRGSGSLWSMQFGRGYVIGTGAALTVHTALDTFDLTGGAVGTAPEDHREGIGQTATLEPQSLYLDQLERRLQRVEQEQ